jgi:parallel beta-helix repeat protein
MIMQGQMPGQTQGQPLELYVHPTQGDDTATGDSVAPFKTLTYALKQAIHRLARLANTEANTEANTAAFNSEVPGTLSSSIVIQLSRGTYSAETGEEFPLLVPTGIAVTGNMPMQGKGTVLEGSGSYRSASFGLQNVTVVLEGKAEFQGVTVTNLAEKGTGIWIESARPTVSGCTLAQCSREGILVTGTANPEISSCLFQGNQGSGLTLVRQARGEIRNNVMQQNGFGMAISDQAAPIVSNNQITENQSGLVISGMAAPILRGNALTKNKEDGLAVFGKAQPDLGQFNDPAGNRFRNNQRCDLHNATASPLTAVGNQLNPAGINGSVRLLTTGSPYMLSLFEPETPPLSQSSQPTLPTHAPADLHTHWAAVPVQALLDRRILSAPDGSFHPDAPLTATEFWDWMQNAALMPEKQPIEGQPEGQVLDFANANSLDRLTVIASLVKALDLPNVSASRLHSCLDRAQVPSSQTLTVATALQHRLIASSLPDRLQPLAPVTRAEAAAMLYQALAHKGQVAVLELPQILQANVITPLIQLPTSARPPIVVLDPGHGGQDTGVSTGVSTQVEADETSAAAMPELSPLDLMSPLPAGSFSDFSDFLNPGMADPMADPMSRTFPQTTAQTQKPRPSTQMPLVPPPGMPVDIPRMPGEPPEMPSLEEKTITLAVAQAAASFLQQQGIQVILTRSEDQDCSLAERVAIAAQYQADVFISLHANASLSNQPTINGVETYHNPSSAESMRLAWAIHKTLTRIPDVEDRGVHGATFATLRQTVPAAQIEVGYITGNKDAPSLANLAYHRYLGRSIANGILRYVRQR